MAGRRKTPSPYPPRVYPKHGALHYVDRNGRWHLLIRGTAWTLEAERAKARIVLHEAPGGRAMENLLKLYLAHCKDDLLPAGDMSARTIEDKESEITNLTGFFGQMAPALVQPHHVGAYKQSRGKQSRVQCNHELSTLSSAFAYGLETGLAPRNPVKGIRRWKVKSRRVIPSEALVDAFLIWCRKQGDIGRLCAATYDISYLTTQRRGDILRIRTANVDEADAGGITFLQRKVGETVEVIVEWTPRLREAHQEALAWRRQYRRYRRSKQQPKDKPLLLVSPWLFCNRKGEPYTDKGFKSMFGKLSAKWVKAGNARVRWHDGTRARGTTKLKQDGRQAHEVTGHMTEATAERIYDRRKRFKAKAVE